MSTGFDGMMGNGLDGFQNFGKENLDLALKSATAISKGLQALAAEAADYSKRNLDASASALEGFFGAQSLDKAVKVQSDYVRSAYESYVGQVAKVSEIVTDMAMGAYKPYEGLLGRLPK
ncbi:MAG: phasin family protein [Bauldia sp.]